MSAFDISDYHDEILNLKRRHYNAEARKNILVCMINLGLDNNDKYKKCWLDYIESYVDLEEFKKRFMNNCILPKYNSQLCAHWTIDFDEEVLYIYD